MPRIRTSNSARRPTRPTQGRVNERINELLTILPRATPNVLLIGDDSDLAAVFQRIQPHLRPSIVPWVPDLTADVPAAVFGTLLVKDARRLDSGQQARLARIAEGSDVQIVSMASTPIYPLIDRGGFLEELYYRLNIVTVDLTVRTSTPRT